MILIITALTLIFLFCKSYVYRFDNFRHTLTDDKHFASMLTPMSVVLLSIFAWIVDISIIVFLYLKFGILISIIFITVINLIPKFLSLWFPLPNYQSFLINSRKLIHENTKQDFINHPEVINALTKIEIYTE